MKLVKFAVLLKLVVRKRKKQMGYYNGLFLLRNMVISIGGLWPMQNDMWLTFLIFDSRMEPIITKRPFIKYHAIFVFICHRTNIFSSVPSMGYILSFMYTNL